MSDERGSMTVLAVALLGGLFMVAAVAMGVAQWAVASVRLAGAADLAALAGAQSLVDPCATAARAAALNDVRLVGCVIDGVDVVTTVEADAPPFARAIASLFGEYASVLQRSARAGEQQVEQPEGT